MKILFFSISFLLILGKSHAQVVIPTESDSTTFWRIVTADENEYIGQILSVDSIKMRLKTQKIGVITLQTREIRKITKIENPILIDGEVREENNQVMRYFLFSNGYAVRKGETYYQNIWVLFNQITMGLGDHINLSIGTMPLFFFGGTPSPVWANLKASFPIKKDKLSIGGGVLAGSVVGAESGLIGLGYGNITIGSRSKNLTFGVGYGFSSRSGSSTLPLFSLSGMVQIGKRSYLITENHAIGFGSGEYLTLISVGGRYVGKKVSLDYGAFTPVVSGLDRFFAIPWVGIVIPLGKQK
ncbi:MAG: hypothetical protein EAZ08_05120 [Cytophagales bacterium]|nr:MAG: hypothetical protein EAZ08_05120 [Cytophagales bacterium]